MIDIPERLIPGTPEWDRYYYEHSQRYEYFAPLFIGKTVLDAACGVGYGSQILALAGAKQVTGVDIANEAVLQANKYFCEPNILFQQADVTSLPMLNDQFEAVVSFETIEHLQNPRLFVKELFRVLKPGGLLVISTPNRDFSGKNGQPNPYHISEMSFTEFVNLVGDHFVVHKTYTQTHSPNYLRHLQLLEHLNQMDRAVRHSILLRFENRIRRVLNKWTAILPPIPASLEASVPGDYVIIEIQRAQPHHLTFVLEARKPGQI